MKYKVGDVVIIKQINSAQESISLVDKDSENIITPGWNPNMSKFGGAKLEIKEISSAGLLHFAEAWNIQMNRYFMWHPSWVYKLDPRKVKISELV